MKQHPEYCFEHKLSIVVELSCLALCEELLDIDKISAAAQPELCHVSSFFLLPSCPLGGLDVLSHLCWW